MVPVMFLPSSISDVYTIPKINMKDQIIIVF